MSQNIVQYVLNITTTAAQRGLRGLQRASDIAGRGLTVLTGAAVAVTGAAVAMAGAIGKAIKEVADLVNELNDLSIRSGLATETISALRFALVASGQSAESLEEILGAIGGKFAELTQAGSETEKRFQSFGISVRDVNGKLRSNNDILLDVIKNINGIQDPSERSRRALLLVGEAGSKLNQALAAGDFQKFITFTNEFGVKAGPEASQAAAKLQLSLSTLNAVMNGTLQRFTEAIGGSEAYTNTVRALIGFLGGLGKVFELNKAQIGSLGKAFFDLANVTIGFFNTFLQGEQSVEKGLLGLMENIFLFGTGIVRFLINPIKGFIFVAAKAAELVDSDMSPALRRAAIELDNLSNLLNIDTVEGYRNFTHFTLGAQDAMQAFDEMAAQTTVDLSSFTTSITQAGTETESTTEKIRTLNDVLRDAFGIKFDGSKLLQDFQIVLSSMENGFITFTKAIDNSFVELGNVLIRAGEKGAGGFFKVMNSVLMQLQSLFDGISIKIFEGFSKAEGSKVVNALSNFITSNPAFTGILGALKIAEGLGQRGSNVAEIEKSVEQDIRARAKAIELGLQALPRILFDVLPPLFIEFADRVIFGLFKGLAEFVKQIINGFKSIFTREGLKNIGKNIKEGFRRGLQEFFDRINIIGGILSKRSGGRYIPSARGGIKFTGADEGLAMLHRGEFVVPETGQMPQAVQRTMGMGQGGINITINASVVESNAVDELVRQIERRFQTFGSSTSPLFGGR